MTHLPCYGMLLSLSVLWIVSEFLHDDRQQAMDSDLYIIQDPEAGADSPSVLFFLGILLAVGALGGDRSSALCWPMVWTAPSAISMRLCFLIGLLSAVVDNVPLVAAVMGCMTRRFTPTDAAGGSFWLCCGYRRQPDHWVRSRCWAPWG